MHVGCVQLVVFLGRSARWVQSLLRGGNGFVWSGRRVDMLLSAPSGGGSRSRFAFILLIGLPVPVGALFTLAV